MESSEVTGNNWCSHEGLPKGNHMPGLKGCESAFLQAMVKNHANSLVGRIKQAVEMLGLPESQERAAKKAIADIIWDNVHNLNQNIYICCPEGERAIGSNPELVQSLVSENE